MGNLCFKAANENPVVKDIAFDDINKEKEFQAWAQSKGLKPNTITKLIDEDLDDLNALVAVPDTDLNKLGLTVGQLALLKKAIQELRDEKRTGKDEDHYTIPKKSAKDEKHDGGGYLLLQHTRDDVIEDGSILKAMFDFTAQESDELDFKADDRFILLDKSDENGWWRVRHSATKKEGYVPSNYVVQANNSDLKAFDWWIDIERNEAVKLLLSHGNPDGTFLIRRSTEEDTLALSVKYFDPNNPKAMGVRHYKIILVDGGKCYLTPKRIFTSVAKLIEYYKEHKGLCCNLVKTCPKEPDVVPFKEIEIARESLTIVQKLGKGNFGEVYEGKWRNQLDVAVKQLTPGSMYPDEFLKEAKTMHKLRHRKLVQLLGVCSDEPMYIVTELMVNGCLRDYLMEKGEENIDLRDLVDFAAQIADGMSYLESLNFIHRDVRAANMLVGSNNIVKVADFGLARMVGDGAYISTGSKFPVKWTAPEAIEKRIFTIKSDVWSFGVLLYELVTYGSMPYPGVENKNILGMLRRNFRMKVPDRYDCPEDIYDTMLQCWITTPSKRPTFIDLHNFFARYKPSEEIKTILECKGRWFANEADDDYITFDDACYNAL